MNNISPISADAFKNLAFSTIQIPGFHPGDEPIAVQVKATGIMSMLANGTIPNTLMAKVTELFGNTTNKVEKDNIQLTGISEEDKVKALSKLNESETGIKDMAELLKVFAAATMVQPAYEDVKDYMTDEQLMAVFGSIYGEVTEAETFHTN